MGSEMIGAIGLGALLLLMVLRVPVALAMLVVGVVGQHQHGVIALFQDGYP